VPLEEEESKMSIEENKAIVKRMEEDGFGKGDLSAHR
jgi:hypothetical protein